jgi:hypothetical protein
MAVAELTGKLATRLAAFHARPESARVAPLRDAAAAS